MTKHVIYRKIVSGDWINRVYLLTTLVNVREGKR
jgi:hypothetical protein